MNPIEKPIESNHDQTSKTSKTFSHSDGRVVSQSAANCSFTWPWWWETSLYPLMQNKKIKENNVSKISQDRHCQIFKFKPWENCPDEPQVAPTERGKPLRIALPRISSLADPRGRIKLPLYCTYTIRCVHTPLYITPVTDSSIENEWNSKSTWQRRSRARLGTVPPINCAMIHHRRNHRRGERRERRHHPSQGKRARRWRGVLPIAAHHRLVATKIRETDRGYRAMCQTKLKRKLFHIYIYATTKLLIDKRSIHERRASTRSLARQECGPICSHTYTHTYTQYSCVNTARLPHKHTRILV